jgi:putative phosphoesterase
MKVALIADTHGTLDPRIESVLDDFDLLVHAGDVGAAVAEKLAALAMRTAIVQGNNDPASRWPEAVRLDLPGGELAVMHGHQWPARTRPRKLRAAFAGARAIVCGHSHRRVLDTEATPWLLNPGAAGRARAYGGPGYIALYAECERWQARALAFEPLSKRRR